MMWAEGESLAPLTTHTGRTAALRRRAIDTDQIIPSEFCKRVTKRGYADGLFARWRSDPGFPLNQPERTGASVLLAAPDFGTGSSREHAVWALRDGGFVAVLAASFGDIFHRNALKNGLLAIRLDEDAVAALMDRSDADPGFEVTVDLERCEVRYESASIVFEMEQRARWLLLNGLDDIEVTLRHAADIAAYELHRSSWLPEIRPGGRHRPAAS
jgi:3-isopropylmalate/(R)-2-methylmalate dehydratase small subunit